ncbi:MAG: Na+:solute symporter, partial [Lewinella sp.]|nr:Na+:solute symporter [Lewinella sp.]
ATVSLAAIKIGSVLLGLAPWETLLVASVITVIYTSLGGLRGVIITDFFQFTLAMIGMIWAAVVILKQPEIGGVEGLLNHPELNGKLSFLPDFNDWELTWTIFILPLAVQWWAVWYPGAEPGGGGYIVQRMLSAKDEKNAIGATLLFNIAHYALRPWPWILIALASLVFFPLRMNPGADGERYHVAATAEAFLAERVGEEEVARLADHTNTLAGRQPDSLAVDYRRLAGVIAAHPRSLEVRSLAYIFAEKNEGETDPAAWSDPLADEGLVYLQLAQPELPVHKLGQDLGFSLMLRYLPPGLLGLLVAALVAAFMSTLSTHLNWGASYLVNDVYRRFYRPEAGEQEMVRLGRILTVVLMALAALLALVLENALDAFYIILQIGAGTGLIFILRWFWWRINAFSEITAMVVSFLVAIYFEFIHGVDLPTHTRLLWGVGITTASWLAATWLTRRTDIDTLIRFYRLIRPHSAGWDAVIRQAIKKEELFAPIPTSSLAMELSCLFAGCFLVYGLLFATGWALY